MVRPIANRVRGASHVGGSIATGAGGTVVVRAIDNMSFEIGQGERVGLIGHNGAGKTTLLRTMAGIYEPTAVCSKPPATSCRCSISWKA